MDENRILLLSTKMDILAELLKKVLAELQDINSQIPVRWSR